MEKENGSLRQRSVVCLLQFLLIHLLMDNMRTGFVFELLKFAYGGFLIYYLGAWFGIDTYITGGTWWMEGYWATSFTAALVLFLSHREAELIIPDKANS